MEHAKWYQNSVKGIGNVGEALWLAYGHVLRLAQEQRNKNIRFTFKHRKPRILKHIQEGGVPGASWEWWRCTERYVQHPPSRLKYQTPRLIPVEETELRMLLNHVWSENEVILAS